MIRCSGGAENVDGYLRVGPSPQRVDKKPSLPFQMLESALLANTVYEYDSNPLRNWHHRTLTNKLGLFYRAWRNDISVAWIAFAILLASAVAGQRAMQQSNEMSNSIPGKIRSGMADRDRYENGMIIRFGQSLDGLSSDDMLIIRTPGGFGLSMQPEKMESGRLFVMASIHPAMTLRFSLHPVDQTSVRLEMEPHHVDIVADFYTRGGK
jgi:hypothetical protein